MVKLMFFALLLPSAAPCFGQASPACGGTDNAASLPQAVPNTCYVITAISGNGSFVTATVAGVNAVNTIDATKMITVAGVTPFAYNGVFTVSSVTSQPFSSTTTFTYASTATGTATGLGYITTAFTQPDTCPFTGTLTSGQSDACGFEVAVIAASPTVATINTELTNASDCGASGKIVVIGAGAVSSPNTDLQLPTNPCGLGKWTIIRPNVADSLLPPVGTRTNLSYIPSMVTIAPTGGGADTIYTITPAPGSAAGTQASYYWLTGLDVATFNNSSGLGISIGSGNGSTEAAIALLPDHIAVDRCTIHAASVTSAIKTAIRLDGTNTLISGNYIYWQSDPGIDSQAMYGVSTPGPVEVLNNYVECGSECIIVGGSDALDAVANSPAATVPSDFTYLNNYFSHSTKNWLGSKDYIGMNTVTKNDIEFKQGQRVRVEGNVLDNLWDGYTQYGYAFVLIPKQTQGAYVADTDTDITIRYNLLRNTLSSISMTSAAPWWGNGPPNQGLRRYSIHDNIWTNSDCTWTWHGLGTNVDGCSAQGTFGATNLSPFMAAADSVTFDHNTIIGLGTRYASWDTGTPASNLPMTNFKFTNNIFYLGTLAASPLGFMGTSIYDCNALMFTTPRTGAWDGNAFVGLPATGSPSQQSYGANGGTCNLQPPSLGRFQYSTNGGALPDNTAIYFAETYVLNGQETTPNNVNNSALVAAPFTWKPGTSYVKGNIVQDGNGDAEYLYFGTSSGGSLYGNAEPSGASSPAWPLAAFQPLSGSTSEAEIVTCDNGGTIQQLGNDSICGKCYGTLTISNGSMVNCSGGTTQSQCKNKNVCNELAWIYEGPGMVGAITTPNNGSNTSSIVAKLSFQDGGPETGWRLYACTSNCAGSPAGNANYMLQTQCGSTQSGLAAVIPLTGSCTLTSITAATAHPPSSGGVAAIAPKWACFPQDFAHIGFVDYQRGVLSLLPSSPCKGKGTNGSDPGANYTLVVQTVNPAINGTAPSATARSGVLAEGAF